MRVQRLHPDRHGAGGDVLQPGTRRGDEPLAPDRRQLLPQLTAAAAANPRETARRLSGERRVLTPAENRRRRPRELRATQQPAETTRQLPKERACASFGARSGGTPGGVFHSAQRERVRFVGGRAICEGAATTEENGDV